MSGFLGAPIMLWGLLGVSLPVIIHLLSRRRAATIEWGAMQFLDIGRRARRKFQITELLLMAGRMLLLALVALALARPFWSPRGAASAASPGGARGPRDVVVILDGSDSMDRRAGGSTPRARAMTWMATFADRMKPGDSAAILVARDRVRAITNGLSYDPSRIKDAIRSAPPSRGSSDLAAAIAEALRVLESGRNPASEIVILGDGQRLPWRPGEAGRWSLLRDLRARLKGRAPRLTAVALGSGQKAEGSDAAVAPIEMARGVYPPNATISVTTHVTNGGPEPATRSAELLLDGAVVPGTTRSVGPIPPGGKVPLAFRVNVAAPGAHLIGVRISGAEDALAANDLAERPVEVAEALPVLLVDGEPGVEPLSGEADFLRAALAPAEDEAPAVRARVVKASEFGPESLRGRRVAVLANVDRLAPDQLAALTDFLSQGGGVLVAPGDRTDAEAWNRDLFAGGAGPMPASLGEFRGSFARREVAAHPSPRSFAGPALGPFGQGDSPPLGHAGLFGYRVLQPASSGSAVIARLDTGDPWAVERPFRKGRVILLAGPLDAEGGTLPVNPDFVPMVHEIIYRLADPSSDNAPHRPGESIRIALAEMPPAEVTSAAVTRPDGSTGRSPIVREGDHARVVLSDAAEPGIYRVVLPGPSGGFAYASVAADGREADLEPLAPAEAERLSQGWPLAFAGDVKGLDARLLDSAGGGPRPLWRWLVLAALGGLCVEVFLTRQLALGRGMTAPAEAGS